MKAKGKPILEFDLAQELTARVTLLLYKWILVSHLYMYYKAIQEELKLRAISPDEARMIADKKETEKVERRNGLMERYKVSLRPHEEYRIALQKAYYTHKGRDAVFDQDITKMVDDYAVLTEVVYSTASVPEFAKDPFEMEEAEFEEFYKRLVAAYPGAKAAEPVVPVQEPKKLTEVETVKSTEMTLSEIKAAEKTEGKKADEDEKEKAPAAAEEKMPEETKAEAKVEEKAVEKKPEEPAKAPAEEAKKESSEPVKAEKKEESPA